MTWPLSRCQLRVRIGRDSPEPSTYGITGRESVVGARRLARCPKRIRAAVVPSRPKRHGPPIPPPRPRGRGAHLTRWYCPEQPHRRFSRCGCRTVSAVEWLPGMRYSDLASARWWLFVARKAAKSADHRRVAAGPYGEVRDADDGRLLRRGDALAAPPEKCRVLSRSLTAASPRPVAFTESSSCTARQNAWTVSAARSEFPSAAPQRRCMVQAATEPWATRLANCQTLHRAGNQRHFFELKRSSAGRIAGNLNCRCFAFYGRIGRAARRSRGSRPPLRGLT